MSPEVRQVNPKQVGGSDYPSNNDELIDMLKAMKQEIKEMDKQLQIQLQLRDEYMDTELK